MITEYMLVGEVLKPQGIRGEAKLKIHAADPEGFLRWKTLYKKSGEEYMPLKARCSRVSDGFAYVTLEGCASPEDVDRIRGQELYIDRAHAEKPGKNETFIADLIGCEGIDEAGESIGILSDVLQYGPVDTWVFKRGKKSMMVPALLRVFPDVDAANGKISVNREALNEVAVVED